MSENLTWKDDAGNIMTRATKAQLAKRLYKLECFLRLCVCCDLEKYHVSTCAKLMKKPHVTRDPDLLKLYRDDIVRQAENYRQARAKRDNMLAVLTKGAREEPAEYEDTGRRSLSREQAEKLMMVLRDNGVEPDECLTVAEAICYVTDLDETILREVEK